MKFRSLFIFLIAALPLYAGADTETRERLEDYPKERVHLFLLAGQSNMAGRGRVHKVEAIEHPRIFAWSKEGKWVPARDPLHYDKRGAGVGPGMSFALELVETNESIVIGLIPAACGGSSIQKWVPGAYHDQTESHPYDDAIARTRKAMQYGELKGILWHQGESNAHRKGAQDYEERLEALILRFRTELDVDEVPFVIGQLGQFSRWPWHKWLKTVDQAQRSVAAELPNVAFVSSEGLGAKDRHHFNAEAQREFGQRYAEVYRQMVGQ